jgi:hypothetical protein
MPGWLHVFEISVQRRALFISQYDAYYSLTSHFVRIIMTAIDSQRPHKFFRYSKRPWLERSLTLGEFRLRPPVNVEATTLLLTTPANNYLTLAFSQAWDESLFELFGGADSCLIIHNTEEFGERVHRAAQKALPSWAGIDAAISYGAQSPLGRAFSKPRIDAVQKEWMFAWRPIQSTLALNPIFIQIGNIEDIAELRDKGTTDFLLH